MINYSNCSMYHWTWCSRHVYEKRKGPVRWVIVNRSKVLCVRSPWTHPSRRGEELVVDSVDARRATETWLMMRVS